jgi:hypothetical protein
MMRVMGSIQAKAPTAKLDPACAAAVDLARAAVLDEHGR